MKQFEFGKNWLNFIDKINSYQIIEAQKSLQKILNIKNLENQSFIDIGCGSGIFSLSANNLGAKVFSFDSDLNSVKATKKIKQKFGKNSNWAIKKGSILNQNFISSLGKFNIVYAWGVLHHTGNMWPAIENTLKLVSSGGKVVIAIYNDQGGKSKVWRLIKYLYTSYFFVRILIIITILPVLLIWGIIIDIFSKKNILKRFRIYQKNRGMSYFHDLHDWLGGYPFEVAKPREIIDFIQNNNFKLIKFISVEGTLGNNQFVFEKISK